MTTKYFSDHESGRCPRESEEFSEAARGGIVALAGSLVVIDTFERRVFPQGPIASLTPGAI